MGAVAMIVQRDVVVIGASAGGVEALRTLVSGLSPDFPAAILVVLHVPAKSPSALPAILGRVSRLPVAQATSDAKLKPGHIMVAAPDHHLIVFNDQVTLTRGPSENGYRPAVDVLFRSAARAFGPRAIGVVLSGALDDGTAGLVAIRSRGGVAVVQDPADALHRSMPQCAIEGASPEHVVPVREMPALLTSLVSEDVDAAVTPPPSALLQIETAMADLDDEAMDAADRPGDASGLSCPDCNGILFRIEDAGMTRFRCRVGHAWSPESLVAQQATAMESALWMALRSLEERAALTRDMSSRAADRGHVMSAESFAAERQEALEAARLVRELIGRVASGSVDLAPARQAVQRNR